MSIALHAVCHHAGLHHPSFDSSPIPYALTPKQSNPRSLEVGGLASGAGGAADSYEAVILRRSLRCRARRHAGRPSLLVCRQLWRPPSSSWALSRSLWRWRGPSCACECWGSAQRGACSAMCRLLPVSTCSHRALLRLRTCVPCSGKAAGHFKQFVDASGYAFACMAGEGA